MKRYRLILELPASAPAFAYWHTAHARTCVRVWVSVRMCNVDATVYIIYTRRGTLGRVGTGGEKEKARKLFKAGAAMLVRKDDRERREKEQPSILQHQVRWLVTCILEPFQRSWPICFYFIIIIIILSPVHVIVTTYLWYILFIFYHAYYTPHAFLALPIYFLCSSDSLMCVVYSS